MFENFTRFFKKIGKAEPKELDSGNRESKETAKERLHMVLMQDRANVSADFLELMKQEIIDVIKKYIEVNEDTIDVRLTTKTNEDGSNGTPSLYANIPILNIRNDMKVENYKFALQSDGSIIAEKIEEPKEEIEENLDNKEIESENVNIENLNNEKIISEIQIKEDIQENKEPERSQDEIDKENELKIEQRQNDIIKEIIPAMENLEKYDSVTSSTPENTNENIEEVLPKIEEVQEETIKEETPIIEEEKKEEIVEPVIPLKKSARRGRPKKDKKEKLADKKKNKEEKKSESSEDDDDDDVTFDDLLKAAEEEDRKKAEQEKKRG